MPNIAKILKDEIQRLAKHEIKVATDSLRKDNTTLKRTVVDLKRRLAKLESINTRQAIKAEASCLKMEPVESDGAKARITGKMIRSIRSRLGLSQDAFAKLVGVSGQAVYQWERKDGRLDLRGNSMPVILALRKMGKREVKTYIDDLARQKE